MPLLPVEPFVFPDNLFTDAAVSWDEVTRWWVLHTRPRAEKALSRRLLGRGIPFFLPVHEKRWRSNGRTRAAFLPLFPGYVFLLGDRDARVEALQTKQVAQCLPVTDQARLHEDLLRVHRLMLSGFPLTPEDGLRPGARVEIIDGPLTGLEGKVLRQGKKLQFVVEIDFIQRGASVEIDAAMIRPLSGLQENRPQS